MKKLIRTFSCSTALLSFIVSTPVFAAEKPGKDSAQAAKAAQKDKHDHEHEGHAGHAAHGEEASGTGKTDIRDISSALHENLTCLEKEIAATNHDAYHACLETIEALGLDLIALKGPADPAKKKRVNGYAKNLKMMALKVDEYMEGKQPEKAQGQLKKLKGQIDLIESQLEELKKTGAPGK